MDGRLKCAHSQNQPAVHVYRKRNAINIVAGSVRSTAREGIKTSLHDVTALRHLSHYTAVPVGGLITYRSPFVCLFLYIRLRTKIIQRSTVFGGRPFVKRFALCYRSVVCPVCLSCPVCDVRALWPNGWTDQDETWRAGRPRPRPWPHCVRWALEVIEVIFAVLYVSIMGLTCCYTRTHQEMR